MTILDIQDIHVRFQGGFYKSFNFEIAMTDVICVTFFKWFWKDIFRYPEKCLSWHFRNDASFLEQELF